MMRRSSLGILLFVVLQSVLGCGGSPGDDESTLGVAPSALLNANSLAPAALAGAPGALSPAALAGAALSPEGLGADAMAVLASSTPAGALSRQLLEYAIGCAFDPTQSFDLSWVDADGESQAKTYSGMMSLAPEWAVESLADSDRGWVSACLISRVNYFGLHVSLSSRGANPALDTPSAGEVDAYSMEEGAFWGDVFSDSPVAYACDVTANDEHSRTAHRVCAAGLVEDDGSVDSCGIIQRVGSCEEHCAPLTAEGGFHPQCGDSDVKEGPVITVFLQ